MKKIYPPTFVKVWGILWQIRQAGRRFILSPPLSSLLKKYNPNLRMLSECPENELSIQIIHMSCIIRMGAVRSWRV